MSQETEIPQVRNMKPDERVQARIQVAMKDAEHMIRWLHESGRPFLIFKAEDAVRSLSWPHGCEALQQFSDAYDHHRGTIPTGRTRIEIDPITKEKVEVPVMKGQQLEPEEMEMLIRHLVNTLSENDPQWSLEKFLNVQRS